MTDPSQYGTPIPSPVRLSLFLMTRSLSIHYTPKGHQVQCDLLSIGPQIPGFKCERERLPCYILKQCGHIMHVYADVVRACVRASVRASLKPIMFWRTSPWLIMVLFSNLDLRSMMANISNLIESRIIQEKAACMPLSSSYDN